MIPWSDCKVAFSIGNADPFDSVDCERGTRLPRGWELSEVDGTGGRWVVVFRVKGIPATEDGERVKRWLRRIGACPG